jgi:hypothetical protein
MNNKSLAIPQRDSKLLEQAMLEDNITEVGFICQKMSFY